MGKLTDLARQLTEPNSSIMRAAARNGVSIPATSATPPTADCGPLAKVVTKQTCRIDHGPNGMPVATCRTCRPELNTPVPVKATTKAATAAETAPSTKGETDVTTKTTKAKTRTPVKGKTAKAETPQAKPAPRAATTSTKTASAKPAPAKKPDVATRPDGLKAGTKKALIADMVTADKGATEKEMCAKLGWKACMVTVRRVAEEAGIALDGKPDAKAGATRWFGKYKKAGKAAA